MVIFIYNEVYAYRGIYRAKWRTNYGKHIQILDKVIPVLSKRLLFGECLFLKVQSQVSPLGSAMERLSCSSGALYLFPSHPRPHQGFLNSDHLHRGPGPCYVLFHRSRC